MYPRYQHRTIFHFMIKQHAILAWITHWISSITSIVSWSPATVTNQLSLTSIRSSSTSTSSAPSLCSSHGALFWPEPYRWEFDPSSIHNSCNYAHHALLTYKICRTAIAVLVQASTTNESYLWHVFLLLSI